MNLVLTKNLNLFKDKKNKHIKHNIFNDKTYEDKTY